MGLARENFTCKAGGGFEGHWGFLSVGDLFPPTRMTLKKHITYGNVFLLW